MENNIVDDGTRPWGGWSVLDQEARYKVKRLVVRPGGSLSMQKHYHRREVWVVVVGTLVLKEPDVDGGYTEVQYPEGNCFVVPTGSWHQIYNNGKIHAVAIEVQMGEYLEEDDIVRDDTVHA